MSSVRNNFKVISFFIFPPAVASARCAHWLRAGYLFASKAGLPSNAIAREIGSIPIPGLGPEEQGRAVGAMLSRDWASGAPR